MNNKMAAGRMKKGAKTAEERQEAWMAQMDRLRDAAAKTGLLAQRLGNLTLGLVGRANADPSLLDAIESMPGWANQTGGPREAQTSLAEYFEVTRNALNEAVNILDLSRAELEDKHPTMVGKPPAWA